MKKALLVVLGAALAIAIYWLGLVNGVYCAEQQNETTMVETTMSDEEFVDLYVQRNFGPGYYGVLEDDSDTSINFTIYSLDGTEEYFRQCGGRELFKKMYEQYR